MRKLTTIIVLLLSLHTTAFGWGQKGHYVTCYIAECHLTPAAKEAVEELLDGHSMVYYADWADNVKYTKEYEYTRPWHYLSMNNRDRAESVARSKGGDMLSALEMMEATLRDNSVSREERAVALKLFIHIMGDMHQPLHLGRAEDKGGDLIPVVYFIESTSLHAVWDHHVPTGVREWSYTEWQKQIDRASATEEAEIIKGGYREWIDQTHDLTVEIYRDTPAETRIFYEYMAKYRPVVEQQFLYGGLRLAKMLNGIYSKE